MADEADRADAEIEAGLADALWRARQIVKPHLGHCWCGALQGRRYCGPECHEEYLWAKSRGKVK